MKYVTYFKNNLMVDRIYDKKPLALTDNLDIAQCQNIITAPQYGYLKVKNLQTKIEEYKEIVDVIDEETQQPIIDEKTSEIKTVEITKQREYQVCELEAVENPNKGKIINRQKINELKKWFDTEYRKFNEMLTRRQSLNIDKPCIDKIRNKTYYTLAELYCEAEIVVNEINYLENLI